MLHKWKSIISNWISCYLDECNNKQDINVESLLCIISHLRENLNLDESKSSLLEANNIEEFVTEKYPDFKFENGTVEAITQEELYISASLLLYFVCVNSKDMDMKLAMCSKLSTENQEIILKFSKHLMECTTISYRDVQTAIIEACGQDMAVAEVGHRKVTIAETPPALRSLHGEVRRLQAALDAERFDRNFLQEELARTNLRLEKLGYFEAYPKASLREAAENIGVHRTSIRKSVQIQGRDKEQYKLDIVNLKAKISMCCGQEIEAKGLEARTEVSTKLIKELEDMEERLVKVQGELDEVQYEKNLFKSKVDDLKRERDKWLTFSQEESTRASQLAEELEKERQQVQNLKELVSELRQHNHLNHLDTSQLEYDDPDATLPSNTHNLSTCSEVCANVIEVQLSEERAKIITLKEQIQSLQEKINDMSEKYEFEKIEIKSKLSEKETEILNLKHRVNEEIDNKKKLNEDYNVQMSKLYTQIHILEQKIKDDNVYFQQTIDSKMTEIQALEEEKSCFIRSLSDETIKFENIIQSLKSEVDTEKTLKLKMKDNYEKILMELNQKVVNRNNELVELQDKIFEKSENIEQFRIDLKKQKELNEDTSNKCNHEIVKLNEQILTTETQLQQKIVEIEEQNLQLEHKNQYIIETHTKIEVLNENIIQLQQNIATLGHCIDDRNATINSIQTQLQNEIEFKTNIQDEMESLKIKLSNQIEQLKSEILNLESDKKDKENIVATMNMCLKDEKSKVEQLEITCRKFKETINIMTEEIDIKTQRIEVLNNKLDEERYVSEEESREKDEMIQITNQKYLNEVSEKNEISNKLNFKCKELIKLETEYKAMQETSSRDKTDIISLKGQLVDINSKYIELQNSFNIETNKLMARISEIETSMKDHDLISETTISKKESIITTLNSEKENLLKVIALGNEKVSLLEQEKRAISQKLDEEVAFKSKIEKECQNQCTSLKDIADRLTTEIILKNKEIQDLNEELQSMARTIEEKHNDINNIEHRLAQEHIIAKKLIVENKDEIKRCLNKIVDLETLNQKFEIELNNEKQSRIHAMEALNKEIEQLHFTIEEENSNHEIFLKEKDNVIERLEKQLQIETAQLESIQKDYEEKTFSWEKQKIEIKETCELKDKKINKLKEHIKDLENKLDDKSEEINKTTEELHNKIKELTKEKHHLEEKMINDYNGLQSNLAVEHAQNAIMVYQKDQMVSQLNAEIKSLAIDKNELTEKNLLLTKQVAREKSISDSLQNEKNHLVREKKILSQELIQEKSVRNLIEKENNIVLSKISELQSDITQDRLKIETLLNEKECLIQQLIEEKSLKEFTEKERENLVIINKKLEEEIEQQRFVLKNLEDVKKEVDLQLVQVLALTDSLKSENELIHKKLADDNSEKAILNKENQELRILRDMLTNNLEVMKSEKLTVETLLIEEKAARDELETEKDSEIHKLIENSNKFLGELNLKQNEVADISAELEQLKTDCKKYEALNKLLSDAIDVGLSYIVDKLKNEDISSGLLKKLLKQEDDELQIKDKCELLLNVTKEIASEFLTRMKLAKALERDNFAIGEMKNIIEIKEKSICDLETHIKDYEQKLIESKAELFKVSEMYKSKLETKTREITTLQNENASVSNELTDLKIQLEVKVHSLKEKLVDNENLTEKLKQTYESQINNLNIMMSKLTNFLKDKTLEVESSEKDKEKLQHVIENKNKAVKLLEDEIRCHKQNQEKLVTEFESERVVLKNMVTVTESVMMDQKCSLNKMIAEHVKNNNNLKEELKAVKDLIETERNNYAILIEDKETAIKSLYEDLQNIKDEKQKYENDLVEVKEEIKLLQEELKTKDSLIMKMETTYKEVIDVAEKLKIVLSISEENKEFSLKTVNSIKTELIEQIYRIKVEIKEKTEANNLLERKLIEIQETMVALKEENQHYIEERIKLENEKEDLVQKIEEIKTKLDLTVNLEEALTKMKNENTNLLHDIEESKKVVNNLEHLIKHELEQNQKLREEFDNEKLVLTNKYLVLQELKETADKQLEQQHQEILSLNQECKSVKTLLENCEKEKIVKDEVMTKIVSEKEALISKFSKELAEEKDINDKYQQELECKAAVVYELRQKLEGVKGNGQVQKKEIQPPLKVKRESYAVATHENIPGHIYASVQNKEHREHQVDTTPTSDLTHSSMESLKTISDLEMIIHDKNRSITTLQSDVTYLKTLMAESENKLMDVSKDLEVSQENCQQLSSQLKKIVQQKNEEIAELKKQVNKMSATENRASQIIKVSAKYQAMILKRIAEIKSTTVLKELTNFGNTPNCDHELKRSLCSGAITMEELENFLETTDKHLKKCSEKQLVLQKDRDRLAEVNKIHESEIINMKKFLTEMSVSFKTFSSVKEVYTQKFSLIVSLQRTVRREILNLEGHITDSTMCKLERGYASVMQDLSECAMTMERWVERCVARTLSSEKMKQAFTSELDRVSLASITFQNTGLEVQLQELEISFQKLLEEVSIAQKGDGARSTQEITVMEVRAEYEDKLNRMKAKMKQLYQEQIQVFREKQKEEVGMMERELQKARDKLEESSREYENHIKALTTELWKVGEKFLMKKDEADWLRRKQRSDSLMSLQHVHSAGLVPPQECVSRPSDTYSLRSLQMKENKNERGVHMSDEEGEVFDNRCLSELGSPPARLSELRWRNSLCPPHLKSSYPAETQFAAALHEEDIKCMGAGNISRQRKEVGITAYKKPGPPTPSKQAGRLSATDSELRESLRVEADPQSSRKTSTPSRLRSLFRSGKNDTIEGTPRSKRLSFFRKKQ